MSIPAADRMEAFLSDILAGPEELAAVLSAQRRALRELPLGLAARPGWRFIGMGRSRVAALDAAARLRSVGRDAQAEVASASGGSPGGGTCWSWRSPPRGAHRRSWPWRIGIARPRSCWD